MPSLSAFSQQAVERSLKRGQFVLKLGPFSHLVKANNRHLFPYLQDTYRNCDVALEPEDVTDIFLNLEAPNVIRRYVRPQVVPDPGFQIPAVPLPSSMAPLAFEMGLNLSVALKNCRFVTIHGGVVAKDKGAVLISAASGGGKSTLTAALVAQGYRLFSDEFALLGLRDYLLHPYPRPISLKQESIPIVRDLLGQESISPVLSGTPKGNIAYARPDLSSLQNAHIPEDTRLILFPAFAKEAAPMARRLNPAEAVMRLVAASTNYSLLGEPAFRAMLSLVKGARTYEITYGTTEQSVELVTDLMDQVST